MNTDQKIGQMENGTKLQENAISAKEQLNAPSMSALGRSTSAAGRQIISGISTYFPDEKVLIGKKCAFVTNLEPRTIRGLSSNGMILAVSGESDGQEFFSLLETVQNVLPGSVVK